jgi:hypothetical protein
MQRGLQSVGIHRRVTIEPSQTRAGRSTKNLIDVRGIVHAKEML